MRSERFRHPGGDVVTRDKVAHPGAVGVVAVDAEDRVWLVRQPREAIRDPGLLELPAGKLDVEGETPLQAGRRELAEEIGKAAAEWELLARFYTSAGFSDEEIHVYLATGLTDVTERPPADDVARIEVVTRPLAGLDGLIAEIRDAKTLVGLMALRARRG